MHCTVVPLRKMVVEISVKQKAMIDARLYNLSWKLVSLTITISHKTASENLVPPLRADGFLIT
jgi:hypothetical protein